MRLGALILTLLLALPFTGAACEPILPLAQLLSGSSVVGPLLLTQSILWLFAAIAVKCGAFVCFERRMPWRKAVLYMLLANLLSTIPGFLIAALTGSISGIIFAVPLVALLGTFVGLRVARGFPKGKAPWINGWTITLAFIAFFYLSLVTFYAAQDALSNNNFATHWISKFLFVTVVACTGLVISAALEECVIARLSKKSHGNVFFYRSVIRANYVTLALILTVAAIQLLPKRLSSPHFIASGLP